MRKSLTPRTTARSFQRPARRHHAPAHGGGAQATGWPRRSTRGSAPSSSRAPAEAPRPRRRRRRWGRGAGRPWEARRGGGAVLGSASGGHHREHQKRGGRAGGGPKAQSRGRPELRPDMGARGLDAGGLDHRGLSVHRGEARVNSGRSLSMPLACASARIRDARARAAQRARGGRAGRAPERVETAPPPLTKNSAGTEWSGVRSPFPARTPWAPSRAPSSVRFPVRHRRPTCEGHRGSVAARVRPQVLSVSGG